VFVREPGVLIPTPCPTLQAAVEKALEIFKQRKNLDIHIRHLPTFTPRSPKA